MIETIALIFIAWNAVLQTGWFIWSYNISKKRKHFTDAEAAGTEIALITNLETYINLKVENEIVIRTRDREWSEFMAPKETIHQADKKWDEYVEFDDDNSHLTKDEDGKFNPNEVIGKFDEMFGETK